jgi:hypothetical protein
LKAGFGRGGGPYGSGGADSFLAASAGGAAVSAPAAVAALPASAAFASSAPFSPFEGFAVPGGRGGTPGGAPAGSSCKLQDAARNKALAMRTFTDYLPKPFQSTVNRIQYGRMDRFTPIRPYC